MKLVLPFVIENGYVFEASREVEVKILGGEDVKL